MDARELKDLFNVVLKDKGAEQFIRNLTFVVSYLISEQDKRQKLAEKLEEHASKLSQFEMDIMLTKNAVKEIEASSKANGRMLRAILTAVVSGIILEGLKLIFHK
jgi:hypothetical protein